MKAPATTVLIAAAGLAFTCALPVDGTFAAPTAPAFAHGLLWRVSKPGQDASFVFGTIHIADARVATITAPVADALARSRTLAMEVAPEAVVDTRVFELEEFDDGRRLEPLIGSEAFAALRSKLPADTLPQHGIERLKPWAAMIRIARVPSRDDVPTLDRALLAAAHERRMRVLSLELIDEQIAAFDAIPIATQVALLKHALAHGDALAATTEPTIAAWLAGDLAALARIDEQVNAQFPHMRAHYRQLARHIIDDRTVLLHFRLAMPLRTGHVFVAVGASHLYGDKGLLALLRRDGFRVERLW
jgi:uncharacterized protein